MTKLTKKKETKKKKKTKNTRLLWQNYGKNIDENTQNENTRNELMAD